MSRFHRRPRARVAVLAAALAGAASIASVAAAPLAHAEDSKPPGPVTKLAVAGQPHTARLTWVNPKDSDFDHVIVRMALGQTPPATPGDGTAVYNGGGTAVTATHIANGKTYSFSVWAADTTGNTSAHAAHVTLDQTHVIALLPRPARVIYGKASPIDVGLDDPIKGDYIRHARVRLYTARPGKSNWHLAASAETSQKGMAEVSLTLTHSVDVRAVYPGGNRHAWAASKVERLFVVPALHASYRNRVAPGGTVLVQGSIAPNLSGALIRLQQRTSNGWANFRATHLDGNSRFAWSFTISQPGTYDFRIMMPPTRGFARLISAKFVVHVG